MCTPLACRVVRAGSDWVENVGDAGCVIAQVAIRRRRQLSKVLMLVGVSVVTFLLAFLWWWQAAPDDDGILRTPQAPHAGPGVLSPDLTRLPDADAAVADQVIASARFELVDLGEVQIGEVVSFFLPHENREIQLTVSETRQTPAGNKVVIAEKLNAGIYHRLILTIGQYQSFGNIQTERDRYQFAIADGSGDIHAVSALNRRLDGSRSDFVVRTPEQELPLIPLLPEKIEVTQ